MARTIEVEISEASFPTRCCRCQQPDPPLVWPVDVRRGIDAIVVRWQIVGEVDVPICERCASRRTWGGRLAIPLLLLFVFGWILAAVALLDGSAPPLVGAVAMAGPVPALLVARFRLRRWVDLHLVGAAGVRLSDDDRFARLQIADDAYAAETLTGHPTP